MIFVCLILHTHTLSQVFIIFIFEKLLSIDAVPTGSDVQTLAKICKLGNIGLSVSFF